MEICKNIFILTMAGYLEGRNCHVTVHHLLNEFPELAEVAAHRKSGGCGINTVGYNSSRILLRVTVCCKKKKLNPTLFNLT